MSWPERSSLRFASATCARFTGVVSQQPRLTYVHSASATHDVHVAADASTTCGGAKIAGGPFTQRPAMHDGVHTMAAHMSASQCAAS